MLVGTDLELREDEETLEKLTNMHLSPISYRQGLQLQREIGAAGYIECSARTKKNLKMVFDEAILVALNIHTKPTCPICKNVIKDSSPEAIFL